MESEMKYAVPSFEIGDLIWNDSAIAACTKPYSSEEVPMHAVYYDTEDYRLAGNNIAIRLRSEGECCFATLKWGGREAVNGHHVREEINIPVDKNCCEELSADIFRETPVGEHLIKLAAQMPLIPVLTMDFTRRRRMLLKSGSVIELALDSGEIKTPAGSLPISELELELYAGEEDILDIVGGEISEKYGLAPENASKFERGIGLIASKNR